MGFFNDSRKKKQQQQQTEAERQREVKFPTFFEKEEEVEEKVILPNLPPPVPAANSAKERYDNFQSSLDLVSIHEEPSSLSTYTFDYDANSFYEVDSESSDTPDNARKDKSTKSLHPLLLGLRSDTGREELKKGLIYGEIIQRKY